MDLHRHTLRDGGPGAHRALSALLQCPWLLSIVALGRWDHGGLAALQQGEHVRIQLYVVWTSRQVAMQRSFLVDCSQELTGLRQMAAPPLAMCAC
jgi:hypothetical protein